MEGEALGTRHVLSAQVKEHQCENIFHTHYHVNNRVCNLIIDGGSCANVMFCWLISYNYQHLNTLGHTSCCS